MLKKFALCSLLSATLLAPSFGDDIIFLNEPFDDYADDTAFLSAWVETIGNGTAAAQLTDQNSGILTSDSATFPGIQGKAVDHIGAAASTPGMVNQYGGVINQANGQNPVFPNIVPSATQSVVLSVDIFESGQGNERMTVGLRHINVVGTTINTSNIIEMGFYNSNSADPTNPGVWADPSAQNATAETPGFYNGRGYGTRVTLFGPFSSPLEHGPDWQYFRTTGEEWGGQAVGDIGFTSELDRETDADEFVSIGDVGAGWHRYTATVTPDTVTIELDLFRDGKRNTSRTADENGDRPGEPGIDARLVFPIAAHPVGFNSLRIGGPSGLNSAGPGAMAFDNILLMLKDVDAPPVGDGDFDGDGDVDGRDFLVWQRGNSPNPFSSEDLSAWQANYGGGELAALGAVPEPATALLLAACGTMLALGRRR